MATYTAPPQATTAPRLSRWRINAVLLFFVIFAVANGHKLFTVQIQDHEHLSDRAANEYRQERALMPHRGVIRDSDGDILAMNVDRDTLGVAPPLINDDPRDPNEADRLAFILSPLIGKTPTEIKALMTDHKREYNVLAKRLSPETSKQIAELKNNALSLTPEPIRVYPHGMFAANIVGVANHENVGISGVEGYNNALLAGVPGSLEAEVDSASNPIWIDPPKIQEPRDGVDITLTIDPAIQRIVEEELAAGIDKHKASGGSIMVMDPQTGAVLGMASWPKFDPNNYGNYAPEIYNKNTPITDLYEPGSTFKPINLAIGLEAGAFTVDTFVNDPGFVERGPGCCYNWNQSGNPDMNPANVIFYSSNVGALQFAEMTGEERFYQGLHDFGYGEPTGIELGGEQNGLVQWYDTTEGWQPIVLSTNGYGQGIAVTPIQHVRAMSAIANGGNVMKPYIIKEWCEKGDCHQTEPKVIRQVISQKTADAIKPMMVRSANGQYALSEYMWGGQCMQYYSEGGVALVPGYNIAAKTGTSSIPNGVGGYENATIGSVLGFGPVENPRFTVLVKLDRTQDVWGTSTIPVYAKVFSRLFQNANIAPNPDLVKDCQR